MKIIGSFFTILLGVLTILSCPNIYDVLLKIVQENPEITMVLIILLLAITGTFVWREICSYYFEENKKYHINKTKIQHPILIFDDEKKCLRDIMGVLAGSQFDIVTVRDISDYRLAENFDIIIGDVYGVGPVSPAAASNSIAVLNAIKEKYPYKIVIAMSKNAKENSLLVDDFVSKENRDEYPQEILDKIKKYSKKMDDVETHWQDTEVKLKEKGLKSDQIKQLKSEYYKNYRKER